MAMEITGRDCHKRVHYVAGNWISHYNPFMIRAQTV
jgi:hypothetical protein